ncbi:MAG TPA: class I SAM-dependent methyltransferase [Chloroflexota bacterium]|jgi:SAM-dependent methyltransferase
MTYESNTYGDRIAAVYDAWVAPKVDVSTAEAVDLLAALAGTGAALELGSGTGRIALPLAQRGVRVSGIDASEAMVQRMREKPGGAEIPVTIGDFESVPVEGSFALIYVTFNTFFALLSQEAQVRCFASVAQHLLPDGKFVIEAFVPDPTLFDRGQRVSTTRVEVDRLQLDATLHDPVLQRTTTQHVMIGREGIVLLPVQLRYAWPSELDLMARLAGLRLETRHATWRSDPFIATSPSHVSVYVHAS